DRDLAQNVLADDVSLFARDVLKRIDRIVPKDDRSRAALDLLRRWDGAVARDRPEPLIFNSWMRAYLLRVLAIPGVPLIADMVRERPELVLAALDGSSAFCRTAQPDCAILAADALHDTLAALADRYGSDMSKWRWDSVHYAPFRHPLFDRIPGVNRLTGF